MCPNPNFDFEKKWKEEKKQKILSMNRNPLITEDEIENLINDMWKFYCSSNIKESVKDIQNTLVTIEQ